VRGAVILAVPSAKLGYSAFKAVARKPFEMLLMLHLLKRKPQSRRKVFGNKELKTSEQTAKSKSLIPNFGLKSFN
jgi:hypothetical protein